MAAYANTPSLDPTSIRTMYGAAEWGVARNERRGPHPAGETIRRPGVPPPGLAVVQEADGSDDTTAQYTHDEGVTIMPGRLSRFPVPPAPRPPQGRARSPRAVGPGLADVSRGAFGVLRGSSGAFTTPYLFTGKERDPGRGLDYFIARQYAPTGGVFLSKDPIPTPTWMYSYVHQGPLSGWDPDGLWGRDTHHGLTRYLVTNTYVPLYPGSNTCWKAFLAWGPDYIADADQGVDDIASLGRSQHFSYWDYIGQPRRHTPLWDRAAHQKVEFDAAWIEDVIGDCRASYAALGRGLHSLQDDDGHGLATPCEHQHASNSYWLDHTEYDTDWSVAAFEIWDGPLFMERLMGCGTKKKVMRAFQHTRGYYRGSARYVRTRDRTEARLETYLKAARTCFRVVRTSGGPPPDRSPRA